MAKIEEFPSSTAKPDAFIIPDDITLATPKITERETLLRNIRTWPELALLNLKYGPITYNEFVSDEGVVQLFIDTIPEKFKNPKILEALCKSMIKNGKTEEENQAELHEILLLNNDNLNTVENPHAKEAVKTLANIIYNRFCSSLNYHK